MIFEEARIKKQLSIFENQSKLNACMKGILSVILEMRKFPPSGFLGPYYKP